MTPKPRIVGAENEERAEHEKAEHEEFRYENLSSFS